VVYHTDQDPKRGAKPRLDREGLDDISMAGLRHHHGHAAGALTFHTASETAQAALRASQGLSERLGIIHQQGGRRPVFGQTLA
jgi:hypothetical protein